MIGDVTVDRTTTLKPKEGATGLLKKGCAGISRCSLALICGKVIQRILCGQAITVAVANLLECDRAFFIENERRWVSRLLGRIPTQSVEIGDLIVGIGHKNNIGR